MKLFATLKKIREFEKLQLPFLRSILDFDILIEIGLAEETRQPLTPKQLFLLELGSATTVRRRLATLVALGIVTRRTNARDRRSNVLAVSPATLRLLNRYGKFLTATTASG